MAGDRGFDASRRWWAAALLTTGALFVPGEAAAQSALMPTPHLGVFATFHKQPGARVRAGGGVELGVAFALDAVVSPVLTPFVQLQGVNREGASLILGTRGGAGMPVRGYICSYVPVAELSGELALVLGTRGLGYRYGGSGAGAFVGTVAVTHADRFGGGPDDAFGGYQVQAGLRLPAVCMEGRPVREAGAPCLPDVLGVPSKRLQEARCEHSSVAEFLRIARLLRALGAPGELVARARRAAVEEAGHAALAYALAAEESGVPVLVAPMTVPSVRREARRDALHILAVRSRDDGAEEAAAAARAEATIDDARGAARALALRIATEEADHARFADALVAWCRTEGVAA